MESLLASGEMDEQTDSDGVVKTYTARFSNGWQADIKVCNAETENGGPYVDPVLFDEWGCEQCIGEVGDDKYVVIVERVPRTPSIPAPAAP